MTKKKFLRSTRQQLDIIVKYIFWQYNLNNVYTIVISFFFIGANPVIPNILHILLLTLHSYIWVYLWSLTFDLDTWPSPMTSGSTAMTPYTETSRRHTKSFFIDDIIGSKPKPLPLSPTAKPIPLSPTTKPLPLSPTAKPALREPTTAQVCV